MAVSNIREISVQLGADVANFVAGMNNAKRTVSGVSQEMKEKFARINAQTDLMVENLKRTGTQSQVAAARISGLSQKLSMQTEYVRKLDDALSKAKAEFGATSNEVKKFEMQLMKASTAEARMKNQLAEMKNPKAPKVATAKSPSIGPMVALGTAMGNLAAGGIAMAGSAMVDTARKSIMMASSLTEVQNVVDTTFGQNAGKVDAWSKTVTKGFGMSELSAKQFAGTMGAQLKSSGIETSMLPVMSQKLTELAGDFASFYNINHEDAWTKIRAGISGETEPLRQLGINMTVANLEAYALSKGIKTSYEDMSQAAQVSLRYNYLLENSADAQGDFAKTSGSFANQLRLAKVQFDQLTASIGAQFIPILTKALTYVNGLIDSFGSASNTVGEFGNFVMPIMEAFRASFARLIESAQPIMEALKNLYMENKQAIDSILAGFVGMVNGVISAVGPFATAVINNISAVINTMKALWSLLNGDWSGAMGNFKKAGSDYKKTAENMVKAATNFADGMQQGYNNTQDVLTGTYDITKQTSIYADMYAERAQTAQKEAEKALNGPKTNTAFYMPKVVAAPNMKDLKKGMDKAANEAKEAAQELVDKVKSAATGFRDALGLFEKAATEKMSGEKLLKNLKSQVKVMEIWKSSIEKLRASLGTGSALFQTLLAQGPSAAFQVDALSKLSATKLAEYSQLYNTKGNIAGQMASTSVAGTYLQEARTNQVVVNVTGNNISNTMDVENIANQITKKLKLAGVY